MKSGDGETRHRLYPGVAQFGSALEWGSRGRWFDSSHSDQVAASFTLLAATFLL